jgi:uncharacterized protein (DUF2235 family)
VARLAKCVVRSERQLVYYDPGVGTLPEPDLLSKVHANVRRWISLATGFGLTQNVQEAYTYLMDYWQPGDKVFLFGFSRGAYTVRVLAGLLHILGLLPPGNHQLVPYLMRLYSGIRDQNASGDASGEGKYWRLVSEFRGTFARTLDGQKSRMFPVHFLGAWDTVSSVGWFWEPLSYPFTAANPSVATVRHAVAIDERRWFFRQNLFQRAGKNQDLLELWFPGAHCDVGGGYGPDEGGLWKFALQWMIDEAKAADLVIDQTRLDQELDKASDEIAPAHIHDALTWQWWPAEFVPKRVYGSNRQRRFRLGLGGRRHVHQGALIHQKALEFMRNSALNYRPSNLSESFHHQVGELPAKLPDHLPHTR